MKLRKINTLALAAALSLLFIASLSKAERIKDLAMLEGARTNQLVGFGLIVGLDGSGEESGQPTGRVRLFNNAGAAIRDAGISHQ